jgi:hypothetical protein
MSVRIAALTAAVLTIGSVSSAQTARTPFSATESRACRGADTDYAKKREELVRTQTRISNSMMAIADLRDGQARQEQIEFMGKLHSGMGGIAGAAKVTKAMSDTFLDLTQAAAPHVKKAYDAFDALVAGGVWLWDGNGAQGAASGFESVQKAGEAYDEYLKRQKGMIIRPGRPTTPGVVGSALKGADDLRRGDVAGTASNVAAGAAKLLDSKAKKSKLALGAGSKVAAGLADTPGKTMDSRFADDLGALGDLSKLAANAAHTRGAGTVAGIAGRTGRLLGNSGMMLEQVSKAKQGLAESSAMYDEYKRIEEQTAGARRQAQRQIDKKLEDIARLRGEERTIQLEVNRALFAARACHEVEDARLRQNDGSTRSARASVTQNRPDRSSRYTWDRRASQQRRERVIELRNRADERRKRTSPPDSYSSPGPNYQIQYPSTPATPPSNPPAPRPDLLPDCPERPESTGSECIPYPKETVRTR